MNYINSQKGFSLLEVLLSLLILSIILVPVIGLINTTQLFTSQSNNYNKALYLAGGKLEELKSYPFDMLTSINDKTKFVNETDYYYTLDIETESDYLKVVTVTVYFYHMKREKMLTLTMSKAKR